MRFVPPVVLAALALACAAPAAAQAPAGGPMKIGVFDPQRVTNDTAEGAKIQARLKALQDRKTGELKKMQEEYEKMQQEYVTTATSLSDDKKKDLGLRLQRKQDELESAQKAAQRELQMELEAAQDQWERRVLELVVNYGKQNNFSLIVQSGATLYYSPSVDITADLMKVIDAQPAPAAAPAPAAPAPAPPKK